MLTAGRILWKLTLAFLPQLRLLFVPALIFHISCINGRVESVYSVLRDILLVAGCAFWKATCDQHCSPSNSEADRAYPHRCELLLSLLPLFAFPPATIMWIGKIHNLCGWPLWTIFIVRFALVSDDCLQVRANMRRIRLCVSAC